MRANGVEWGARTWGFYCIYIFFLEWQLLFNNHSAYGIILFTIVMACDPVALGPAPATASALPRRSFQKQTIDVVFCHTYCCSSSSVLQQLIF